jgi:hypothetical protein
MAFALVKKARHRRAKSGRKTLRESQRLQTTSIHPSILWQFTHSLRPLEVGLFPSGRTPTPRWPVAGVRSGNRLKAGHGQRARRLLRAVRARSRQIPRQPTASRILPRCSARRRSVPLPTVDLGQGCSAGQGFGSAGRAAAGPAQPPKLPPADRARGPPHISPPESTPAWPRSRSARPRQSPHTGAPPGPYRPTPLK